MAYDNTAKQEAMRQAKKRAAQRSELQTQDKPKELVFIQPAACVERNYIVFDDSGSMYGELENAKKGVVEFLRNCVPNQTAVGVYFMNSRPNLELDSNLPRLARDVEARQLSSGGTPFFKTIKSALEAKPAPTRLVVFTDGQPTDTLVGYESNVDVSIASADVLISIAKRFTPCVPIDTVFFGRAEWATNEIELLKYLSDKTGGFFLHFDPNKISFASAFKYLAPVNRLALASASFRADVESGKRA
jgi:Mg-chelatase subunit ChlD